MQKRIPPILLALFMFGLTYAQTTHRDNLRMPVLEQFTTENCSNCPPVLKVLEKYYETNHNYYLLCHHAGFMTDFLTIPEHAPMLAFFGDYTTVPRGMVDRHYNGLNNDNVDEPEQTPIFWTGEEYGIHRIEGRIEEAPVTVNISGDFNPETNKLNIDVTGKFLQDLNPEVGIVIWISEDNIPEQYQAGAENFIHRFSSRGVLTDVMGNKITTSTHADDTFIQSYSYDINPAWNKDELYILAMVVNINPSDINDREVHNSKQIKLLSINTHINETEEDIFNIYPNPATDRMNVSNANNAVIEIYHLNGQLVKSLKSTTDTQMIDTGDLSTGIYMVKVIKSNNVTSKKFIIRK